MKEPIHILAILVFLTIPGLAETSDTDPLFMPGTQPLELELTRPASSCKTCHANISPDDAEPYSKWHGGMMGQAARDPLFLATRAIAEQDYPGSGEFCNRCHTPWGWINGRSSPGDGSALTADDREGVQCESCHTLIDPLSERGLDLVDPDVPGYGNAMLVVDPDAVIQGPRGGAKNFHQTAQSEFLGSGDFCGVCHDISNPVLAASTVTQAPYEFGHVERTYSEWASSAFVDEGTAGACQSCHMPRVDGALTTFSSPRTGVAQHDLTGGSVWMPTIIPLFTDDPVDVDALNDASGRAEAALKRAATLEAYTIRDATGVVAVVRVTNLTGHRLPSGFPEGRRMWVQVLGFDSAGEQVYGSGVYDASTAVLTHDTDIRLYESKPGISAAMAQATGLPEGPSFHFVLNDQIYKDNRIPPRGFTKAEFDKRLVPITDVEYEDGQNWDEIVYRMPGNVVRAEVRLLYQSTSKEYVEFLRDENTTNTLGQVMYDLWAENGKCPPVEMASVNTDVRSADLNNDGVVDTLDLLLLQSHWHESVE